MHPGCRIDQVFLCRDPVDFRKSIGACRCSSSRRWASIRSAARCTCSSTATRDTGGATQGLTLQQFEWLLEGFDVWQKPPHNTLHFGSVS